MARRSPPSPPPQPATLGFAELQQAIPRLQKRIAEVEAFDPTTVDPADPSAAVQTIEASIDDALTRTFGMTLLSTSGTSPQPGSTGRCLLERARHPLGSSKVSSARASDH